MEGTGEKKNGNGVKTNGTKAPLTEEAKKEIAEQQAGADKAHAKARAAKVGKKTDKKATPFEAKPVPEAVKGIVDAIKKQDSIENLKAVARELKRHFKTVYVDACKKATEGLKAGNVVWFKKGSKLIEGKVVKVKTTGKVKIDAEDGKTWRVAGMLLRKGHPTGADRAEVTKKAA